MSGLLSGLLGTGVLTAAQIIQERPRAIGPFIPTVVIHEHSEDEMEITRKPVEYGAAITDNAFKEPPTITMHVAWSNSGLSALSRSVSSLISQGFSLDSLRAADVASIYNQLIQLQASAQYITVVTGQRRYPNCLIRRISKSTDVETENALFCRVEMRQIIVVPVFGTTITPQQYQKTPSDTAPKIGTGVKQLKNPNNQSVLYQMFN